MNTIVGSRNALAASPRPRGLTVAGTRRGKAEVIAAVPAAMETATVRV